MNRSDRDRDVDPADQHPSSQTHLTEFSRTWIYQDPLKSSTPARPDQLPKPLVVERTPGVIASIESTLPEGFPASVSDPILRGLEYAARRLVAGE